MLDFLDPKWTLVSAETYPSLADVQIGCIRSELYGEKLKISAINDRSDHTSKFGSISRMSC